MRTYYICNDDGKIIGSGYTNSDTVKVKNNEHVFFSHIPDDDKYHDFQTGKLKPRPTLAHDSYKTILKNENYILTDIPKNTIIKVNGIDYGKIDDNKLVVAFPIAMIYTLELIPPFPYYKKNITIEVKNG